VREEAPSLFLTCVGDSRINLHVHLTDRMGAEQVQDSVHEWFATFAAATPSEGIVMATFGALYDRRTRQAKTASHFLRHGTSSLSSLL